MPTPAAAGGASEEKRYRASPHTWCSTLWVLGLIPSAAALAIHSAGSIPVLLQQLWPWPWFSSGFRKQR